MTTKVTYHVKRNQPAVAKSNRVVKKASSMPLKGSYVVKGKSADNKIKTFRFSVLSSLQQLKERNKAYHFFSID